MCKIYISFNEISEYTGSVVSYPKHVSSVLNVLNQHTQATRPRNVGQITELAYSFSDTHVIKTRDAWVRFYNQQMPGAIDRAVEKISTEAAQFNIDSRYVRIWVEDLIYDKSYQGLLFQEVILNQLAKLENKPFKRSTRQEEKSGVDGWIGNDPVSVKPSSYKATSAMKHENIAIRMIFYKKDKAGLKVSY